MTWLDLHRYTHLWHVFELDIHKRPCMVLDTVWYQMAECTETSSLWAGGISRCDWCDWLKGHGWGLVKIHAPPSRVASTKVWWFSYSGGRCYPPGSQHVPMQFWRFEDGFLFPRWDMLVPWSIFLHPGKILQERRILYGFIGNRYISSHSRSRPCWLGVQGCFFSLPEFSGELFLYSDIECHHNFRISLVYPSSHNHGSGKGPYYRGK